MLIIVRPMTLNCSAQLQVRLKNALIIKFHLYTKKTQSENPHNSSRYVTRPTTWRTLKRPPVNRRTLVQETPSLEKLQP